MRKVIFVIMILVGCRPFWEDKKIEREAIDEVNNVIVKINMDLKVMETIFDSTLNSLNRGESWLKIRNIYLDSMAITFKSVNEKNFQIK